LGWQAQPFALEFKGNRSKFNLCARDWEGYGEVWFNNRAEQRHYKFVPSGIYSHTNDVFGIASGLRRTKRSWLTVTKRRIHRANCSQTTRLGCSCASLMGYSSSSIWKGAYCKWKTGMAMSSSTATMR